MLYRRRDNPWPDSPRVRFIIDLAIAVLVAVATGVSSALWAVDHAPLFNGLTAGVWTAWPRAGSIDADPYDLAAAARIGAFALGSAEGIAFAATSDDEGAPLDGACRYEVSGDTPPARLWTIAAYDRGGRPMDNPAARYGYHSRELLRRPDGTFVITLAPRVQPGNWLPVAAGARFQLALRLYDTPLTSPARPSAVTMPTIRKLGCP
jgi:hypothetical protein